MRQRLRRRSVGRRPSIDEFHHQRRAVFGLLDDLTHSAGADLPGGFVDADARAGSKAQSLWIIRPSWPGIGLCGPASSACLGPAMANRANRAGDRRRRIANRRASRVPEGSDMSILEAVRLLTWRSSAQTGSYFVGPTSFSSSGQLRITLSWRGTDAGSRWIIRNRLPSGETS